MCICARFSKEQSAIAPENKVFVKNSNPSVVARFYKDQIGK